MHQNKIIVVDVYVNVSQNYSQKSSWCWKMLSCEWKSITMMDNVYFLIFNYKKISPEVSEYFLIFNYKKMNNENFEEHLPKKVNLQTRSR